jgi:hypothetical protein
MEVYIDGISVNKNDLKERYNLVIQGRFWGDGVKSWSNFQYAMDEQKGLEYWYTLWGEFEATYNKRTRKGVLITKNFKAQEIHHI